MTVLPAVAAWTAELDRMAATAARVWAALEQGDIPELEPWDRPAGLGPVPASLQDRARIVLRELVDAERAAANHMEQIVRQMDAGRRQRSVVYTGSTVDLYS